MIGLNNGFSFIEYPMHPLASLGLYVFAFADDRRINHRIKVDGRITSAAFSPDGSSLYILAPDHAINVWEILVFYWPEIGAVVALFVAVFALLVLRRVLRTPRLPNEPHCRRCNYCLKSAESQRCPECGANANRPVIGRTARRRLVPVSVLLTLAFIAYAVPWITALGRKGPAAEWLHWWSFKGKDTAIKIGIDLSSWQRPVDHIRAIDVITGTWRRSLTTPFGNLNGDAEMAVTPDGRELLLPIWGKQMALMDVTTGNIRKTLNPPSSPRSPFSGWRQIIGFDESGSVAYLVFLDTDKHDTKLVEWRLDSGESSVLLSVAYDTNSSHAMNGSPTTIIEPHRIYRIPSSKLTFLELKSQVADQESEAAEGRIHFCDGSRRLPMSFCVPFTPLSAPGFSSDGSYAMLPGPRGIARVTLQTMNVVLYEPHWSPRAVSTWTECAQGQIGRMVLNDSDRPRKYWTLDLDSLAWRKEDPPVRLEQRGSFFRERLGAQVWGASVVVPNGVYYGRVFVSPNGQFFAGDDTGGASREIHVYEIGPPAKKVDP